MPAHFKIITLYAVVVVRIFMFATMIYLDFQTCLDMKHQALCLELHSTPHNNPAHPGTSQNRNYDIVVVIVVVHRRR
jgi:hypothetical protein